MIKSVKKPGYTLYRYGPKKADHPSIGQPCLACKEDFKEGDFTTLIPIGPGSDVESKESARNGKSYNAVAIEVHWTCATGIE